MFNPLIMLGKFVTTLDGIDNEAINKAVLENRNNKLDKDSQGTHSEDSIYPETKECAKLIQEVNRVIQKEVNQYFKTTVQWAHILEPKESTMYHTHDTPGGPVGISWVYYSKTQPNCGNIVWCFDVCKKRVMVEHEPKEGELVLFPDFVPHFTKKNNSGDIRISISGNSLPAQEDFSKVLQTPHNIYSFIGICY